MSSSTIVGTMDATTPHFAFPRLPAPHECVASLSCDTEADYGSLSHENELYSSSNLYSKLWRGYQRHYNSINDTRTIVTSLQWLEADSEMYLLACTNEGRVHVWRIPPTLLTMSEEDISDETHQSAVVAKTSERVQYKLQSYVSVKESSYERSAEYSKRNDPLQHHRRPIVTQQVTASPLHTMAIHRSSQSHSIIVVVGGDEGIILINWQDLLQNSDKDVYQTRVDKTSDASGAPYQTVKRLAHFKPHPSPTMQASPVRKVAVDQESGMLYAAVEDAFGCYQWDLEAQKFVRNYQAPYSTTLALIKQSDKTVLLTGGSQDGTLRVWDITHNSLVDTLDMSSIICKPQTLGSPSKRARTTTTTPSRPSKAIQITDCCLALSDSDEWWCVAGTSSNVSNSTTAELPRSPIGGAAAANTLTRSEKGGLASSSGWITTWHAPTRTCVAHVLTNEKPSCVVPTSISDTGGSSLLSTGNHSYVNAWSALSLQMQEHAVCSTPAGQIMAVGPDDCIAVGGVGRYIDVLSSSLIRVCKLAIDAQ
jgi:hypothetical protein